MPIDKAANQPDFSPRVSGGDAPHSPQALDERILRHARQRAEEYAGYRESVGFKWLGDGWKTAVGVFSVGVIAVSVTMQVYYDSNDTRQTFEVSIPISTDVPQAEPEVVLEAPEQDSLAQQAEELQRRAEAISANSTVPNTTDADADDEPANVPATALSEVRQASPPPEPRANSDGSATAATPTTTLAEVRQTSPSPEPLTNSTVVRTSPESRPVSPPPEARVALSVVPPDSSLSDATQAGVQPAEEALASAPAEIASIDNTAGANAVETDANAAARREATQEVEEVIVTGSFIRRSGGLRQASSVSQVSREDASRTRTSAQDLVNDLAPPRPLDELLAFADESTQVATPLGNVRTESLPTYMNRLRGSFNVVEQALAQAGVTLDSYPALSDPPGFGQLAVQAGVLVAAHRTIADDARNARAEVAYRLAARDFSGVELPDSLAQAIALLEAWLAGR